MNKEELKVKLKRYDYKYKEQFEKVIVKLGSSLEVAIDFSENEKVIITDKLRGYNILTGVWSMSVKGSIIFNTILSFFFFLFYSYLNYISSKPFTSFLTLMILVLAFGWIVLWTLYYLIKVESFKILIQSWDK